MSDISEKSFNDDFHDKKSLMTGKAQIRQDMKNMRSLLIIIVETQCKPHDNRNLSRRVAKI